MAESKREISVHESRKWYHTNAWEKKKKKSCIITETTAKSKDCQTYLFNRPFYPGHQLDGSWKATRESPLSHKHKNTSHQFKLPLYQDNKSWKWPIQCCSCIRGRRWTIHSRTFKWRAPWFFKAFMQASASQDSERQDSKPKRCMTQNLKYSS